MAGQDHWGRKLAAKLSSYWWLFVLAVTMLVAIGLRVWGTNFGLPFTYHADEGALVMPALNIVRTGDLRPARLDYGSVYIYSLAAVHSIYFLYGARQGQFATVSELPVYLDYRSIDRYPFPGVFWSARLLTAILGSLTVLIVYRLGSRLGGRKVGLVSAILLATLPLHVVHSHLATTDVPMLFVIMWTMTLALDLYESGGPWDYGKTGLGVGLAASTRYLGGIASSALLVAHLLRARKWNDVLNTKLALGIGAVIGGFLIGTPFALDLPFFLNWLAYDFRLYSNPVARQMPMLESSSLLYYMKQLFFVPSGLIAVAGVLGFVRLVSKDWRRSLVILAFPVSYLIIISMQTTRHDRTILPLWPFLALGAGIALTCVSDWWAKRFKIAEPQSTLLLAVLVAIVAVYPAIEAVQSSFNLSSTDVRTVAREWLDANIPPGAKIAADWTGPSFPTDRKNLYRSWNLAEHGADWYIEQHFEYLVISEPRLVFDPNLTLEHTETYRDLMARFKLLKVFEGPMLQVGNMRIWVYQVRP